MKSIRTKITMCLILTVLSALIVVGGSSIALNYRSTIDTVNQMMSQSATLASERVEQELTAYKNVAMDTGCIPQLSDSSASVEEMKLYDEENKAADIRINNPDDKEGIWLYPYHIVGAGYTKTTTGQEFLARHIQIGDIGQEEFILRDNEQDTVLFSYYEDAVIDQEKIVYMSSVDKNKLSVYDLQTGEEREVIELQDGNIELLTISHNRVYGIWNSIKHMKSFLVYIDLEQTELVSCFEAIKGTEYIVINDTVYYIDQASGNLVCKVLL